MPIQIRDFPEPLTAAAKESSVQRVLIQSDGYRQLVHELHSYCNAQISGRSFLIAGYRGSGKTTLTLSAFEQVWREADAGKLRMRPLLVQLLGPSLLPEFDERDIAEPARGAASSEKKLTEFENVLVQFTLALHRAVVNELTEAYRKKMEELAFFSGKQSRADVERANVCLEAPGQLALELDEYPGKARLREFWQRAGALPKGLLQIPRLPDAEKKPEVNNQGVNELIALCSVSEAYRRISGTIQASNKDESASKDATAMSREMELKGKEFFGPLITLLTGGVVASGVAAVNPGQWQLAVVAGVLTAFGSALVAKHSISRSQQRSSSREELFLPNLSVATLDRVLPVLLDRVRDAGLAPVFIIDELDKVEDLSERIPKMVKRLKKLVAEKAFFCFLTDRRYFEEMSSRNAITPHSVESTYFTNQVFITFHHTDYHWFIGELLRKPEPMAVPGASSEGSQRYSAELDEEIIDHALLPYILLHASQMHPIDLRRKISSYRGENGEVTLTPREIRSNFNRLQLSVQVAIELLLESPEMEVELGRDPAFRRFAHDALYFVSREWQRGVAELHLGKEGSEEFEKYLSKRMITERSRQSPRTEPRLARESANRKKKGRPAQDATAEIEDVEAGEGDSELREPPFTDEEANFLWGKVRELANLLAGPPQAIREQAIAKNVASVRWPHGRFVRPVLDAIVSIPGPLLEEVGESGVFRFRYSRAGRPSETAAGPKTDEGRPAPKTEPVSGAKPKADKEGALKLKIALIRKFDSTLRELTGDTIDFGKLGATFGVIRTSPVWSAVETAVGRLTGPSQEYPEKADDILTVDQFVELLKSSATTLGLSVFCGWIVGSLCRTGSEKESEKDRQKGREFAGLQILSQALGLKTLTEETVKTQIQQFSDDIFKRLKISNLPEEPHMNGVSSVKRWADFVESLKASSIQSKPSIEEALRITPEMKAKAWRFWRTRLRQPDLSADFETVVCAAAGEGPSRFLNFPPEEMKARAWSKSLYEGIISGPMGEPPPDEADAVPRWLASEALRQLGFVVDPKALVGIGLANSEDVAAVDVEGFNVAAQTRETKRNAIILSREGSESENWKAGKEWAALVWHGPELDKLKGWSQRDHLFQLMRVHWLVFDWSSWPKATKGASPSRGRTPLLVTAEEIEEAARFLDLGLAAATDSRIPAITPRDWKGELPPKFFSIPAPFSFDELFTLIARARTLSAPR